MPPPSMDASPGTASDQTAILQLLNEYYAAFSTLDLPGFLPYFHEPAFVIVPQGAFVAATHAVLAAGFTRVHEDLRARGFGRSELRPTNVRLLSATAAIVTGVAIRYKVNGDELERVGLTYVLHKLETGWKIAVTILHDVGRNDPTAVGTRELAQAICDKLN